MTLPRASLEHRIATAREMRRRGATWGVIAMAVGASGYAVRLWARDVRSELPKPNVPRWPVEERA